MFSTTNQNGHNMVDEEVFGGISKLIGGRKIREHIQYNCEQAFEGIDLVGKNVLEIGAGEGILSAYAAFFAKYVTAIEPECAGSRYGYIAAIHRLKKQLNLSNLYVVQDHLQDYYCPEVKYNIVLMHNSVNHLNEQACERLHCSSEAQSIYIDIFTHIASMMLGGAKLVIFDSSRYNFFQMLHIKHPIVPQMEWEKHQPPSVWLRLIKPLGFAKLQLSWTVAYPLRKFSPLLSNRIAAFFLFSHFRLVLSYKAKEVVE